MDTSKISRDMKRVFENALPFHIPNFTQRLRITADVDKYKWKEDESIWLQKKDRSVHSFEVLFDGEFVCFFDLSQTEAQVLLQMLDGLRSLFKSEKVFIHEQMYEVQKAKWEADKTIELEGGSTPEEKIITEVIKKQAKKKGKKVVVKEKKNVIH
jgi:nicotinic acid phosphoribosyltransferase